MSYPKHTPGGLELTEQHGGRASLHTLWLQRIALVERHADARLLAAAYNSYDEHCGPRAIGCAEDDLLGEALAVIREIVRFDRLPIPISDGVFSYEHLEAAKDILAKTKGGDT